MNEHDDTADLVQALTAANVLSDEKRGDDAKPVFTPFTWL